jgi:hypothetical protein
MLFSGCCAVREHPAVWVWNRRRIDVSSFAPKRSFSHRLQILRAARYFAISSKKSIWALKKNDSPWENASTSSPRCCPSST